MMEIKKTRCLHKSGGKDPCMISTNPYIISFGVIQIFTSQIPEFHETWLLSIIAAIMSFINKVGEADPIIDVMDVMLENISTITMTSRTTVYAVYRTAQIVSTLQNLSYQKKAFPEALFHQLLLAMVHPDHETRVVAHRIFSVILVPTASDPKVLGVPRTLSRAVSFFTSSASIFEKLRLEKRSSSVRLSQHNKENVIGEIEPASSNVGIINKLKSSHSRLLTLLMGSLLDMVILK